MKESVEQLVRDLEKAGETLNQLNDAWFARTRHADAGWVAVQTGMLLAAMCRKAEEAAARNEKEYAKVPLWRQKVEQAEKEAREAKAPRVGLERRVVALEGAVAEAEVAASGREAAERKAAAWEKSCRDATEANELLREEIRRGRDGVDRLLAKLRDVDEDRVAAHASLAGAVRQLKEYEDKLEAICLHAKQIEVIVDHHCHEAQAAAPQGDASGLATTGS